LVSGMGATDGVVVAACRGGDWRFGGDFHGAAVGEGAAAAGLAFREAPCSEAAAGRDASGVAGTRGGVAACRGGDWRFGGDFRDAAVGEGAAAAGLAFGEGPFSAAA
jgi:hypothetical protein